MIMEVNQSFRLKRKLSPMSKIRSASSGAAHVEIPARVAEGKLGENWLHMERIFKLDRSRSHCESKTIML